MEISFLLPLGHDPERNRECLESLSRTLPSGWRGEIVVIEDASGTAARSGENLPVASRIRRLRHELPGSLVALQAAAQAASAPVLGFLDAGSVFMTNWLPPMWGLLQATDRVGCIGNIHREPYSGLIDHAGIGFDASGLPVSLGRNLALLPPDISDRRAAVSMVCCLVRREVFERVGGFDAAFHGALGKVDFCLRAAEAGYRHYVANRSVVYRYDTAGSVTEDTDLPLYRERWGRRAAHCHARRERLRRDGPGPSFSPEHWEMARETRRRQRLEIRDIQRAGNRYLRKHGFRPWRYNSGRVFRALAQALAPLPAPLPLLPAHPADTARADDGWLFDPPPQP